PAGARDRVARGGSALDPRGTGHGDGRDQGRDDDADDPLGGEPRGCPVRVRRRAGGDTEGRQDGAAGAAVFPFFFATAPRSPFTMGRSIAAATSFAHRSMFQGSTSVVFAGVSPPEW